MALNLIPTLIDKEDNVEIIRDRIGAILVCEVINQMALATTAGKDADLWNLKIFTEASDPIEDFLNQKIVTTPIVNVWFDTESIDLRGSNVMERQKYDGVFNIDMYGFGVAKGDGGSGQIRGDLDAKLELNRAIRLVRNILMSATNTYLQLRGVVVKKMASSIIVFQPQEVINPVQKIAAARLVLNVTYSEFAPQVAQETLEFVSVDIFREENGELVAEADFDFTP